MKPNSTIVQPLIVANNEQHQNQNRNRVCDEHQFSEISIFPHMVSQAMCIETIPRIGPRPWDGNYHRFIIRIIGHDGPKHGHQSIHFNHRNPIVMNTLKIEEIGSDGLAMFDLGKWCLIVNFDFYIDESSWDSWRCQFSDIDVTIQSIEWGTPDGDVLESNLNSRNKTRIMNQIRNHIEQNPENFGVDTTGLDNGWEPTYQNTW